MKRYASSTEKLAWSMRYGVYLIGFTPGVCGEPNSAVHWMALTGRSHRKHASRLCDLIGSFETRAHAVVNCMTCLVYFNTDTVIGPRIL